jgi:hypothetical protein
MDDDMPPPSSMFSRIESIKAEETEDLLPPPWPSMV